MNNPVVEENNENSINYIFHISGKQKIFFGSIMHIERRHFSYMKGKKCKFTSRHKIINFLFPAGCRAALRIFYIFAFVTVHNGEVLITWKISLKHRRKEKKSPVYGSIIASYIVHILWRTSSKIYFGKLIIKLTWSFYSSVLDRGDWTNGQIVINR